MCQIVHISIQGSREWVGTRVFFVVSGKAHIIERRWAEYMLTMSAKRHVDLDSQGWGGFKLCLK